MPVSPSENKNPEIIAKLDALLSPKHNHDLRQGLMPVLQNREFLILWGGQIFSQLADKVYLVLMIAIIADNFQRVNESISGWVSAIMIAFTIPAVFFGSLAGVYVDRWAKKNVLVLSNLLRGVLVLSLPLLLRFIPVNNYHWGLPSGFWILLVITFFVSFLTQFFAPAEQATLALIIKPQNLLGANSLYTSTMMGVLIVGFAIGDPLLALANRLANTWGLTTNNIGGELLVGGAYLLAGVILLFLTTGETQNQRQQKKLALFTDIQEGINYLRQNERVRDALIQLVILFSVFAALAVLAVSLAETIPGLKAEQFGWLLAACGIGLGSSATFLGNWGYPIPYSRLSWWGALGMAISLLGLALFTQYLWLELILIIALGAFAACIAIPMQTTIQAETPPELRGKIFGLQNNVVNIALSLPLALAGIGETVFGLKSILISLGVIVIVGRLICEHRQS